MAGVSDIPYGASGRTGGGKSGRGRRKGNGGLVRTSVRAYLAGIFKGEDSDSGREQSVQYPVWRQPRASYQVRLPFSVFALDHVTLTSRSRKRGWIGAEGGYFSEKNGSEPEGKWVYVGRDSMRYHLSPSCHYISNQITAAAYADVISGVLRNSGGCRYKACRYCGSG